MNNDNKKESDKICQLCKAGFEVWVSGLNFGAEREEKLRNHFLVYCPTCKEIEKTE